MNIKAPFMVDSHVHLWNPAQFRYSWIDGLAVLNRAFLPADFAAASTNAGVNKFIFVECGCEPAQNLAEVDWVSGLAANGVTFTGTIEEIIAAKPDVVTFHGVFPDEDLYVKVLEAGINIVTTADWITGWHRDTNHPHPSGKPVSHPETIATAIRIGSPASWDGAVTAQQESKGRFLAAKLRLKPLHGTTKGSQGNCSRGPRGHPDRQLSQAKPPAADVPEHSSALRQP